MGSLLSRLLQFAVGQIGSVMLSRQPELSKISNLVSVGRSVGSVANDFRQNGWSLKGSDLSKSFFGGV